MTADGHTIANIVETDHDWLIELDVGDFARSELRVEIDHGFLVVSGDRDPVGPLELQEHLRETFRVPFGADAERAVARHAAGRLEIELPKVPVHRHSIPIVEKDALVNSLAAPA